MMLQVQSELQKKLNQRVQQLSSAENNRMELESEVDRLKSQLQSLESEILALATYYVSHYQVIQVFHELLSVLGTYRLKQRKSLQGQNNGSEEHRERQSYHDRYVKLLVHN